MPFHDSPTDEAQMAQYFEFAALPLYKYALKITHDPQKAEDAVQGTFAEMIHYFDKIRGFSNDRFLAYAKRELTHQCAEMFRKPEEAALYDNMASEEPPELESVIDFVERKATREEIRICLKKMHPRYLQVLQLRYYENCNSQQIGEIMHLSPNHVRVLLTRARSQLKRIYQKEILEKEKK